jgi:hypothetical protein
MGKVSVHKNFMSIGVSPQRVHSYRCQSTEGSWVKVSVPIVFMVRGVGPERVRG